MTWSAPISLKTVFKRPFIPAAMMSVPKMDLLGSSCATWVLKIWRTADDRKRRELLFKHSIFALKARMVRTFRMPKQLLGIKINVA